MLQLVHHGSICTPGLEECLENPHQAHAVVAKDPLDSPGFSRARDEELQDVESTILDVPAALPEQHHVHAQALLITEVQLCNLGEGLTLNEVDEQLERLPLYD